MMVRSDGWDQDIPACDTDRPASSMSWSMEKAPVLMSSLSSAAAALAERVCSCQLCFIGSPTWGSGFPSSRLTLSAMVGQVASYIKWPGPRGWISVCCDAGLWMRTLKRQERRPDWEFQAATDTDSIGQWSYSIGQWS